LAELVNSGFNIKPAFEKINFLKKGVILNILFLCTGNSCRSILAEALLNHLGKGRFKGFSAGSTPAGKLNPLALNLLKSKGISMDGLRSKSWDEFAAPGAPKMDIIITVCDNAAGEVCPIWPGHPFTLHWSLPDPDKARGEEARKEAFDKTFATLEQRVKAIVGLGREYPALENLKAALRVLVEKERM